MTLPDMNMNSLHTIAAGLALTVLTTSGCQQDDEEPDGIDPNAPLEVVGVWNDNFGGWTVVSEETWGSQSVLDFDNTDNWVVTQNAPDAEYSPNAYSLVVWTELAEDGSWWTCTVAYGLDTLDAALNAEDTSDASDPSNSGCGDFSWTEMTPRDGIEVVGTWDDNFGGTTEITLTAWGSQKIHDYGMEQNWAVTQNAADAEYSPGAFNLVVWTDFDADNTWWTCTVAYGLETFEEAFAAEDTSDTSDPANGGCGGFSWTQMTPAE